MKKIKLLFRLILCLIVISLIGLGCYTYFISPSYYSFVKTNYEHKNVSSELNGFKIAYISDMNLNDKKSVERFQKAVNDLNDYPFDMIIFGGDLYDGSIFEAKEVSQTLKSISCKYGKFAILGEKDQDSSMEITQILQNGGFEVLHNEARTLYYKESIFSLIACDQDYDISQLKTNDNTVKICITHQPDSFAQHKKYVDLQLSGHSYGGLIYIPLVGPLSPTSGAKTYNHGTYEESGSTLIVSNGFSGPASFPYKLFSNNQIHIITLKNK